ncbi:MAG: DUF3488 and transglutaminase-like domain-containing protein [Lachnospiraceae bacterium]|nr:DUF3488 and transglutaminase-like domain-containing protein [Lachnospiraceae bacterium]
MINLLYDLICIIPLTLIPTLWTVSYHHPDAPSAVVCVISLLIAVFGIVFFHVKNSARIIMGGVILTALTVSVMVVPRELREEILTHNPWLIPCIGISVGALLAAKFLCSFRVSRAVLALVLITSLATSMALRMPPSKTVASLSFFFVICVCADEAQLRMNRSGDMDHRYHLVSILPFMILCLIFMLIMPAPDEPYDWTFAKKIYTAAADRIDRVTDFFESFGGGDSAESFMGFSDSGNIYGGNTASDKKVLEVIFGNGSAPGVYLAGRSFDTFDGREWIKTYDSEECEAMIDTVETACAVKQYEDAKDYDLMRNATLEIRFMSLHSSHVFAPVKIKRITVSRSDAELNFEGGDPVFAEPKSYNDTYSVDYYRLNIGNDAFTEFLKQDHPDDRKVWEDTLDELGIADEAGTGFDSLAAYRDRIRDTYLSEMELTPRLEEYLDGLLADCVDDTDRLDRIENMLSSMDYSTAPGAIPSYVDTPGEFLDYLIFESQKGYCVHYATAFVLLARHEGIPARFVQGYLTGSTSGRVTQILERDSHAWPECYMEGVGWVIYEPTPGFKHNVIWKTEAQMEAERVVSGAADPVHREEEEIELPDIVETEEEDTGSVNLRYVIIIAAVSLGVAVLLIALSLFISAVRFKHADDEKRFRILFNRNLKMLSILGFKKADTETLEEYAGRCREVLPDKYLKFISYYETYIYRGGAADAKAALNMEKANRDLIDYVKEEGIVKRLALIRCFLLDSGVKRG